MKKTLNKIVNCLAIIAENPNMYSKELVSEIEALASMIDEMEDTNEKEST